MHEQYGNNKLLVTALLYKEEPPSHTPSQEI